MADNSESANPCTSPWGKLLTPACSDSFADIMAEQANRSPKKFKEETQFFEMCEETASMDRMFEEIDNDLCKEALQKKEVERFKESHASIDLTGSTNGESDEMIALMLQAQFDKEYNKIMRTENKHKRSSKVSKANDLCKEELQRKEVDIFEDPLASVELARPSDCASDEMIALMLQTQFDQEHDNMIKRNENKQNGSSKVCISYSNYRVMPASCLGDSESEDEDVEEKSRDWDSFVSSERMFNSMPKCGYKKEGDQMVTKHDIAMSSRRNACRVMSFPPEFQTGDGGGFDMQLSNKVFNSLKVHSRHEESRRNRFHDKSEHATSLLGIDPRTRLILYKLVNQEILDKINGILSTGKESVVMHANGGVGDTECTIPKECAVKIFKTTLNEFKTRDKYIQDDFRFKDRFSKQNPRKIIHLWAEKEMHNLIRLRKANIPCPEMVTLKNHILVMSFIGENNIPAPKLKDAALSKSELITAYQDVLSTMKKLYWEAGLIHADLSEYNILWHCDKCWYIDVSQAVERSHPKALEFLLRDCYNVCTFFRKKGVPEVISPEELFKQITNVELPKEGIMTMNQIQDFERNELLTNDLTEKIYPFDYCWSQSTSGK